ncbi:MAG: thioredoxin domain-containing protein, partial [Acidobacteriaceae bacterium]
VPHFEKMLYDNAGLLANYVHAFQSFADADSALVARDIIRWLDAVMTDRERGGFYASQDADLSLDDDGDYFTWTREEAAAALTADEMAVAGPYFDIGEIGDMHHNPAKNVLHRKFTVEEVAKQTGRDAGEVGALLMSAQNKQLTERLKRPTPYIDRTIYTSWNAMAVSAYLAAAKVLEMRGAREFALKTLDRLLVEGWDRESGLAHVVAYPEGAGQRIAGVLDDYAFLALALLDAWEATGARRYYDAAMEISESMVARFYDAEEGGFFDTERVDGALGVLAARRKPLQDSPTPAGNPTAAGALLRLEALSGRADFHEKAEATLANFAAIVEHFGLHAGMYGQALELLLLPPVQVVVIGQGVEAAKMAAMAMAPYAVNKRVMALRAERVTEAELPPVMAETLPFLPELKSGKAFAVVCRGASCLPPTSDADVLLEELNG